MGLGCPLMDHPKRCTLSRSAMLRFTCSFSVIILTTSALGSSWALSSTPLIITLYFRIYVSCLCWLTSTFFTWSCFFTLFAVSRDPCRWRKRSWCMRTVHELRTLLRALGMSNTAFWLLRHLDGRLERPDSTNRLVTPGPRIAFKARITICVLPVKMATVADMAGNHYSFIHYHLFTTVHTVAIPRRRWLGSIE